MTTWLTTRMAAEASHHDLSEIQRALASGALVGYRQQTPKGRGHWRIDARDLDAWVRGERPGQRITAGRKKRIA